MVASQVNVRQHAGVRHLTSTLVRLAVLSTSTPLLTVQPCERREPRQPNSLGNTRSSTEMSLTVVPQRRSIIRFGLVKEPRHASLRASLLRFSPIALFPLSRLINEMISFRRRSEIAPLQGVKSITKVSLTSSEEPNGCCDETAFRLRKRSSNSILP